MVPLPKTMKPDDPRVIIMRAGLNDPNKISVPEVVRVSQMITYIQLLKDDQSVVAGQLVVMDFSKITMSHLTQMTPSIIKKITMCGQVKKYIFSMKLAAWICFNSIFFIGRDAFERQGQSQYSYFAGHRNGF